ncbi:MAG: aminomethyltransferase family protein [Phycisphaerae bacterium]
MTDPRDLSTDAAHTPLDEKHRAMEARMGTEGGWAVPMSYRGPLDEASAALQRGAVADISHLTRLRIRGDGALDLLERLCTHDVAHQEDDTAALTCLCNERGGIVDCGYLVRLPEEWLYTGDAGNREKLLEHFTVWVEGFDVRITDRTQQTVQFSVVGPAAGTALDAVLPFGVSDLPGGAVKAGSLLVARYVAMRTGYAPAWGLEVAIPSMMGGKAWRFITDKAGENALPPLGMAARDVLRIQAGLPRYGHEMNETIDPLTAGLERCVDFGHDFLGADAVAKVRDRGLSRRPVKLRLHLPGDTPPQKAIPRLGDRIETADGCEVGTVTSGSLSPQDRQPIALGYVSTMVDPESQVRLVNSSGKPFPSCILPTK